MRRARNEAPHYATLPPRNGSNLAFSLFFSVFFGLSMSMWLTSFCLCSTPSYPQQVDGKVWQLLRMGAGEQKRAGKKIKKISLGFFFTFSREISEEGKRIMRVDPTYGDTCFPHQTNERSYIDSLDVHHTHTRTAQVGESMRTVSCSGFYRLPGLRKHDEVQQSL